MLRALSISRWIHLVALWLALFVILYLLRPSYQPGELKVAFTSSGEDLVGYKLGSGTEQWEPASASESATNEIRVVLNRIDDKQPPLIARLSEVYLDFVPFTPQQLIDTGVLKVIDEDTLTINRNFQDWDLRFRRRFSSSVVRVLVNGIEEHAGQVGSHSRISRPVRRKISKGESEQSFAWPARSVEYITINTARGLAQPGAGSLILRDSRVVPLKFTPLSDRSYQAAVAKESIVFVGRAQIVAQILAAMFITLGAAWVFRFLSFLNYDLKWSVSALLRYPGVAFGVVSFVLVSSALLIFFSAFSPGIVELIPLHDWTRSKTLDFKEMWQPYLVPLYFLTLSQVYDHISVIAIFQILSFSILAAVIIGRCRAGGVSPFILIVSLMLLVTSLPLATHLLLGWSDTLFAILSVTVGSFLFFALQMPKEQRVAILRDPLVFVSLLMVFNALVMIRLNGIVYLPLFFVVAYISNLLRGRVLLYFCSATVAICGIFLVVLKPILGVETSDRVSVTTGLLPKINPILAIYHGGGISPTIDSDQATVRRYISPEELRVHLNPINTDSVVWQFYRRVPVDDLKALSGLYPKAVFFNPDIFLSDRLRMFVSALLGRAHLFHNYADQYLDPPWTPDITNKLRLYNLESSPLCAKLTEIFRPLLKLHKDSPLFFLLVWNSVPALLLFVLILLFHRFLPISALTAVWALWQVPFLFLTLPAAHFRYFLFIYLFAPLMLSMIWLELIGRRTKR